MSFFNVPFLVILFLLQNILSYFVHQRLLVPFGLWVLLSWMFVCVYCLLSYMQGRIYP